MRNGNEVLIGANTREELERPYTNLGETSTLSKEPSLRAPSANSWTRAVVRRGRQIAAALLPRRLTGAVPTGVHLCDFDGVRVMLDFSTPGHAYMYRRGGLEPELTAVLARVAEAGDVFVDIGGNVGWHTASLLVRRPDVRMAYVFEPGQRTFDLLRLTISANHLADRCRAHRCALADRTGTARLKQFPDFGSTHSSLYQLADWRSEEEEVPLETLDAVAQEFVGAPAIIKCDVEGAERDVLRGASKVLSGQYGDPPIWFLEANYEAAGMAGYFPYELLTEVERHAPYRGYVIRNGGLVALTSRYSLRHGDTLVLAIPELHEKRLSGAQAH